MKNNDYIPLEPLIFQPSEIVAIRPAARHAWAHQGSTELWPPVIHRCRSRMQPLEHSKSRRAPEAVALRRDASPAGNRPP